jgi:peptidoglycan hydrolase CwlO-like protein
MLTIILIAVAAAVIIFVIVGYFTFQKSLTPVSSANEGASKNELDALRKQLEQVQDTLDEKVREETKSLQLELDKVNREREKIQNELVDLQRTKLSGPSDEHQEIQPAPATPPETALTKPGTDRVEIQPVTAAFPEVEVTERNSKFGKIQAEEIVQEETKLTEPSSEQGQTPAVVIPVQETVPAAQGEREQPQGQETAPDQPVSIDLYSNPVIETKIARLIQEKRDEIENLMGPLQDRVMKIAERVANLEWRIDEQKENATQLNYQTEALVVTVREEAKKFHTELDQQIEDLENIIESEKEIIKVENVLERFTKQTTDAIDRNEQQSKSFADRIYDRIELFGGSLQAQTASLAYQINSQIGKFDELESEFGQLGSKVGQLKPEFEKLGSDFRKLGLVKFLWDKKEEIEVEARAIILDKRLGLRVDAPNTDKKTSDRPDLSRGNEQSPTHETPNSETATPSAEAGRTDERGEGVADEPGARINDPTRSFTTLNVNSVPANFGVYALYKNGEMILYGCTQSERHSIRSCLQEHFRDEADEDRRWGITDYKREFTETAADAIARYTELLETFQRQNGGRLPRYNARVA